MENTIVLAGAELTAHQTSPIGPAFKLTLHFQPNSLGVAPSPLQAWLRPHALQHLAGLIEQELAVAGLSRIAPTVPPQH